jgi:hypothetical protein
VQKWNHRKFQYRGRRPLKAPNSARKDDANLGKAQQSADFGGECAIIFGNEKNCGTERRRWRDGKIFSLEIGMRNEELPWTIKVFRRKYLHSFTTSAKNLFVNLEECATDLAVKNTKTN